MNDGYSHNSAPEIAAKPAQSWRLRLRDWWRGYIDEEWDSMQRKYRTGDCLFPNDYTKGERRAFVQAASAD